MNNSFFINKKLELCLVFLILILTFCSRTYFWLYGYNQGVNGLFIHGDGYYDMAKSLISGIYDLDHFNFRLYQIVYPIYLTPIFIFDFNPSKYVFILHHTFAILTTIFIYLSGKKLNNITSGLIASFLYAVHFQIAFWFNFTLSDICFHFHLSILMYVFISLFEKQRYLTNIFILISAIVLGLIRPEGFLIFFVIIILICFKFLLKYFSLKKSLLIIFSSGLFLFLILSFFIFQNKNLSNKIMSNTHIGWGLYFGSQLSPSTAGEVDTMLIEMYETCNKKSKLDKNKRNSWWWCSKLGIDRIKADPVNYIKIIIKRIPSVFYPSFYREGVSWKYKIVTISFMSFIILGLFFLFITRKIPDPKNRELLLYLFIMSIPTYLIVIFYHNEWDIRIQLSSQVILLTISSVGWFNFISKYTNLYER